MLPRSHAVIDHIDQEENSKLHTESNYKKRTAPLVNDDVIGEGKCQFAQHVDFMSMTTASVIDVQQAAQLPHNTSHRLYARAVYQNRKGKRTYATARY